VYEDTNLQLLYHENLSCVLSSYFSHSLEFRTIKGTRAWDGFTVSQMLEFSFLKKLGMHFYMISLKVFLFFIYFCKKCGGCDNSAYTQYKASVIPRTVPCGKDFLKTFLTQIKEHNYYKSTEDYLTRSIRQNFYM
jgi:hypothetical protein